MDEISLSKFLWVNGEISKEEIELLNEAQKCSFMNSLSKKLEIAIHIICHHLNKTQCLYTFILRSNIFRTKYILGQ